MGSRGKAGEAGEVGEVTIGIPHSPLPIPHSEIIRLQHPSGTSDEKIASYMLIWVASR